jgi:meromycolic acid enoyl-[acyl-carrier-protein] reductase
VSALLAGKRLLITGVLTEQSIAFATARLAQEHGAQIVLTGFGRLSLVERIAKRLPEPPPVIELDVTNPEHLDSLVERLRPHLSEIDGVVHSIAYGPPSTLGGNFLEAPWEDVSTAVHVSAYSYRSLAMAVLPMLRPGAGLVGLTFDAGQAWPVYDWMGVAKAGLESTCRYVARELGEQGTRANLVAGTMYMSGGVVAKLAASSSLSELEISGGTFGKQFFAHDLSHVTFVGGEFRSDGVPVGGLDYPRAVPG